ncbi:MAG TPA: hypothetical protein VNG51_24400 [Ktedonobacteraceae bacterium]|nr:hypothetical protein [Ktedonobacteraceae bacterium]
MATTRVRHYYDDDWAYHSSGVPLWSPDNFATPVVALPIGRIIVVAYPCGIDSRK